MTAEASVSDRYFKYWRFARKLMAPAVALCNWSTRTTSQSASPLSSAPTRLAKSPNRYAKVTTPRELLGLGS